MTKRFRVALTGGAGSGKSRTAAAFSRLGVDIIDADVIAHSLTAPGSPITQQIAAVFGNDLLDAAGSLRRRALRERVFTNPAERQRLEEILHPSIRAAMLQQAEYPGSPYCLLVIPLLIETSQQELADRVLVVDATAAHQQQRLMARDGLTPTQATQMLAAQTSREARLVWAHDVIDNNGDEQWLERQVAQLHARYMSLAQAGHR